MAKEKILVLSVDRDNDIGEKAGHKGPVIGKKNILKAGMDMGLADPSDSDFNALFEAVRIYEELKKQYTVEVAAITGDKDRSFRSDKEISRQLDIVLKTFKATGVVFVTDGADDEHTMPIIQSRVPIISVKRLIVKQAEQLESSYYKIKDFFEESLENPKIAGLVYGLPAIILVFLGLFGREGLRYTLFLLGAFLIVKWFRLEKLLHAASEEMQQAISKRNFMAFFIYVIAALVGVLGVYRGYLDALQQVSIGFFEVAASFVASSIFLLWGSTVIAWLGRNLITKKRGFGRIVSVPLFGFAVSVVTYSATELVTKSQMGPYFLYPLLTITPILGFVLSVLTGAVLIIVSALIDKKMRTGK